MTYRDLSYHTIGDVRAWLQMQVLPLTQKGLLINQPQLLRIEVHEASPEHLLKDDYGVNGCLSAPNSKAKP